MSKAKDDYIAAIESSGDALSKICGDHTLPEPLDSEGWSRLMNDLNFHAKWALVMPVKALRRRAESLRRNDVKQGDWPPFRPEDAASAMEMIEFFEMQARAWTKDEKFIQSVVNAIAPIRTAVEKHATKDGVWRFNDADSDPIPRFYPPPAGT